MRRDVGPTKEVHSDEWEWTENVIGIVSESSKIRIGIKSSIVQSVFLLFAESASVYSNGITFCFNGYAGNNKNFPGYKGAAEKWGDLGQ